MTATEPRLRFVDSIASSPTVRLDLNAAAGPWRLGSGYSFNPPPLKRTGGALPIRDGDPIPATAYGNREIVLPLFAAPGSSDGLGAALLALHRELDRKTNILEWKPAGATSSVFFRTFRSPDYEGEVSWLWDTSEPVLRLVAEPFAYGIRVDLTGGTVTNNPASGTWKQYIDLSGIPGEVETPLYLSGKPPTGDGPKDPLITLAIRRHGDATNVVAAAQAETGNLLTDASLPGNDATASGAGSNYVRVSFATDASMVSRIGSLPVFVFAGADARGLYRALVRIRKSVAGDTVKIRFARGSGVGDTATAAASTAWQFADLGLIEYPLGHADIEGGYSGVAGVPVGTGTVIDVQAQRAAGTGTVDFDYALLLPADEEFGTVDWRNASGIVGVFGSTYAHKYDGPQDDCYVASGAPDGLTVADANAFPKRGGALPMLTPGITNRLFLVNTVAAGDSVLSTYTVVPYCWPRYLYIAAS